MSSSGAVRLGLGLQHQYVVHSSQGSIPSLGNPPAISFDVVLSCSYLLGSLKGSDAALLRPCRTLKLDCTIRVLYNNDDDDVRLADSTLENGDDLPRMWERTEKLSDENDPPFLCVTGYSSSNKVESHYAAIFGNEPSVGYVYGNVVLVAQGVGGSGSA